MPTIEKLGLFPARHNGQRVCRPGLRDSYECCGDPPSPREIGYSASPSARFRRIELRKQLGHDRLSVKPFAQPEGFEALSNLGMNFVSVEQAPFRKVSLDRLGDQFARRPVFLGRGCLHFGKQAGRDESVRWCLGCHWPMIAKLPRESTNQRLQRLKRRPDTPFSPPPAANCAGRGGAARGGRGRAWRPHRGASGGRGDRASSSRYRRLPGRRRRARPSPHRARLA